MLAEKKQFADWSILSEKLMVAIKENLNKPKEERKTVKKLLNDFAQKEGTTEQSAGFYYYNRIKPQLRDLFEEDKVKQKTTVVPIKETKKVFDIDQSIQKPPSQRTFAIGEIIEVEVTCIKEYGVFCKTLDGSEGLIHISEIARGYVTLPTDYFYLGEKVKVKVLERKKDGKLSFSTRAIGGKDPIQHRPVAAHASLDSTVIKTYPFQEVAELAEISSDKAEQKPDDRVSIVSEKDREQITNFIKKYSENAISTEASNEIDELLSEFGVFNTTVALMEAIRDLDISHVITSLTKQKLTTGDCLRQG